MGRRASAVLMVILVSGGGAGLFGSPAHARHNFSMLEVRPGQAAAGDEVTVSGFSYTKTAVVRFGTVDGPVLARLEPTANNDIRGTVRVPPETRPGRYVLFAMHENEAGRPTRFPGRAALVVAGPGGPPRSLGAQSSVEPRPQGLVEREGAPGANLLVVGVAIAGGGALAAAMWAVVARPRTAGKRSGP